MKPAAFTYEAPETLSEAIAASIPRASAGSGAFLIPASERKTSRSRKYGTDWA